MQGDARKTATPRRRRLKGNLIEKKANFPACRDARRKSLGRRDDAERLAKAAIGATKVEPVDSNRFALLSTVPDRLDNLFRRRNKNRFSEALDHVGRQVIAHERLGDNRTAARPVKTAWCSLKHGEDGAPKF
jgi:hypothetical protein